MLPADLAQIRARLERYQARPFPPQPGDRHAAVATILRDGPHSPEVLLIRRAEREGDPWSGHMAFPGGRQEPRDPDLFATACRETAEEVGIDLRGEGELIGRLDEVPAMARGRRAGLVVHPFVFAVGREPTIRPNCEVDEVFWAPLGPLVRGEVNAMRAYEHEGQTVQLPAFDVSGRLVWGLTYHMLLSLFTTLRLG
jgi:8-oxo-dGTP pyrophosphatase MutT (NUDIX family)